MSKIAQSIVNTNMSDDELSRNVLILIKNIDITESIIRNRINEAAKQTGDYGRINNIPYEEQDKNYYTVYNFLGKLHIIMDVRDDKNNTSFNVWLNRIGKPYQKDLEDYIKSTKENVNYWPTYFDSRWDSIDEIFRDMRNKGWTISLFYDPTFNFNKYSVTLSKGNISAIASSNECISRPLCLAAVAVIMEEKGITLQ